MSSTTATPPKARTTPRSTSSASSGRAAAGRSGVSSRLARLDSPVTSYYVLLSVSVVLVIIGLIMVLSASSVKSLEQTDNATPYLYFRKQLMFAIAGGVAMLVASRIPVRGWKSLSLPILGLAYTAFQPYWGALKFDQLTLRNFNLILSNAQGQMDAVWNSTMLGAVGAAIGVLLGFAVSYVLVRTRSRGRRFVEAVAMAPGSIPHTLLGFGFLIVFLQLTQLPLYGTVWGLLTAYSILFLAHATRSMVGVMHQINPDLEEAARLKRETEKAIAEYEQALAVARGKAQAIAGDVRARMAAEAAAARTKAEADIAAQTKAAEARILAAKQQALGALKSVAAEAAAEVVARIGGAAPAADAVEAAVAKAMTRN